MVKDMNYINKLKNDYKLVSDLVIKYINNIYIIYIESLSNQDKINEYILKFITNKKIKDDIKELIGGPKIIDINSYNELKDYLNNGFAIIINDKQIIAIEVKLDLNRSINIPTLEATMYGPKESFVENIQTNIGLIRRRIKSDKLKSINSNIGRYSNTISSILYIDGITKMYLINKIESIISNIDVDGIKDIGELKNVLFRDYKNIFPSIKITERPDVCEEQLLNGKVVILLDNSPYALVIPAFFSDFINPISDNYSSKINTNFNKLLRLFCFFLSIILPGWYIAITTYNQETIPVSLLISFQEQRLKVPYSSYIECFLVLLTCEILKESDIRFPSTYGSAISILGALVLGEAAVSAGIVSPIMIIIVAFSFISSMIFVDKDIEDGIRYFRFLFLIISSLFGLYGVFISSIFLFVYLVSRNTFNMPYFYPISPFDLTYIKSSLFKMKNNKRSKYLSNNRIKGDL